MEKTRRTEQKKLIDLPKIFSTVAPYFRKVINRINPPKIRLIAGEKEHPQMKKIGS